MRACLSDGQWRISRHRDQSGIGGFKAAGRWHYAGRPIVYLAETRAAALLEICVHTSANDVPPEFALLKIEGPHIDAPCIGIDALSDNWRTQLEVTRDRSAVARKDFAICGQNAGKEFGGRPLSC